MGLTVLEVEIASDPKAARWEKMEFLIDSGAVYSVVPATLLEKLSIKPYDEQTFRLANGGKIVRKRGFAFFRLGERKGGSDVIFGEPDDSHLIGALTLESLGLALDPLKRELQPLPMILAGYRPPEKA
ncbi:aspartyl protease family protein [bacterium]|nr:aspartyl protease family protein [bacterium]